MTDNGSQLAISLGGKWPSTKPTKRTVIMETHKSMDPLEASRLVTESFGKRIVEVAQAEGWTKEMRKNAIAYIHGLASWAPGHVAQAELVASLAMQQPQIDTLQKEFAAACYAIAVEHSNFRLPAMDQPWFGPVRDEVLAALKHQGALTGR